MLEQRLSNFGPVPIRHGSLQPMLADYRRPNDKIAAWLSQGVLIPLQRGLYVVGDQWRRGSPSLPLLANHLYGPSCVSLEYALAWHGLIPEYVYDVTSVCTRRSRVVQNAFGRFSYTTLPISLYAHGIQIGVTEQGYSFLIASPTKALCDKLLLTRRLQITSASAMQIFLQEDLRMDTDAFQPDMAVIRCYAESGHKATLFRALTKLMESSL